MGSGKSRDIKTITRIQINDHLKKKDYTKPAEFSSTINILSAEEFQNPNLAFHKISKDRDDLEENSNKKYPAENSQKYLGEQEEDSEANVIANGKINLTSRNSLGFRTLPSKKLPPLASPFDLPSKLKIAKHKPNMKLINDLLSRETVSNFEEDFIEENNEEVGDETLISLLNELTS